MTSSHPLSQKRILLIIASLVVVAFAMTWLLQAPTKEELFGDIGKLTDLLHGGINSWSSNYMLGGSLGIHRATALGATLAGFFFSLLGPLLGILEAFKLLLIGAVIASGFSMFFFVKKITGNNTMSGMAALMMVTMPSIHVTMGLYEHWSIGLCFIFVPLLLRGLIAVAEKNSPREIIGLGLAAAAISLSWVKIAVAISPVVLLWTLEILRQHPGKRSSLLLRYGVSAAVALVTSLLILLPALREFSFATGFELDPLQGWQHHYSFKSALQWIDLWGILMKGAGPDVTFDAAMFAIGVIPLLAISLGLGLPSLEPWRRTSIGRWFLVLVACWLFSIGFAGGFDGIIGGHWNLLKTAQGMANWSIPLLWLALCWLIWIVYQTARHLIGGPAWHAALLTFVFLFLPFFQVVKILPLFKDIRALECFWRVGGFCVLAAAVGIITVPLFTYCLPQRFFKQIALLAGLLFLAELYPIYSAYWKGGLPTELLTQYNQALEFLKTAPLSGRVYPLSTRYFYLTIPTETGHALTTEALFHHFELKGVRYLEAAGTGSGDAMKMYLNLTGTSYVFIDKEDPALPKQAQAFYRSNYPTIFENQFFLILENQSSLYPAFLARNFVVLPPKSYTMAIATFQLAPMNLVAVEMPQVDQGFLGFAGKANGSNQIELLPTYRQQGGTPFLRVPLTAPRTEHYNQMSYRVPPNASGWLTLTEAYHPDWQATIDGEKTPLYCAETALLGIYVPIGSSEITFKFVPPFWYSLTLYLGVFCWIILLGAFVFLSSRWAPPTWKQWWN